REGPTGRALGFWSWLALGLTHDALPGLRIVPGRPTAAVPGPHGIEALGVEACDQPGDSVAGAAPDRPGRVLAVGPAGDREQESGPGDLRGRGGAGATELGELLLLSFGQRAERVFFAATHGASCEVLPGQGTRRGNLFMATGKANDPLVGHCS